MKIRSGLMPSKINSDSSKRYFTFAERRKAPRYCLVAIAELTDAGDAKMLSAKVTEVSRTGCYVDSPKTFPVGTSLKVIISRDQRTFVAKADVIHVQEQMGMGIVFVDPPQDQLKILDSWLAGLPSSSSVGSIPPRSRR